MEHSKKQLVESDHANQSTILTTEEAAGVIVSVVLDEVLPLAIIADDKMDQVNLKNNIKNIEKETSP